MLRQGAGAQEKPLVDKAPKTKSRQEPATRRFVPMSYRVDDAAAIIGLSSSKLWDIIAEGRIPARKIDGATVVRHDDLQAFVDGSPVSTPKKAAQ